MLTLNSNINTLLFKYVFCHIFVVNSDFSSEQQVDRILDTWEELRPDANNSSHHHKRGFDTADDEGQTGVTENKRAPIRKEIPIMFQRHVKLIIRDRTYSIYIYIYVYHDYSMYHNDSHT